MAIALKYNRDPSFISKFTVKGVEQEEEALNVIRQTYQTDEYILKNEELFTKGPLSGTPDSITNLGVLDAKCSWSLFTFPFSEVNLKREYKWQNVAYMALTGRKESATIFTLVNASMHQIEAEKLSYYYTMGSPDSENPEWIEMQKRIERNMIFDPEKFFKLNPGSEHILQEKEWDKYAIPLKDRVKMFPTPWEQESEDALWEAIDKARGYLKFVHGINMDDYVR